MKILILILFYCINGYNQQLETVDLEIIITKINSIQGSLEMGVFNNPKTFLETGGEFKTYSKKVTNDTITFYLTGLKKDYYAVSVYQDINSDNKCNLNLLGKPTEPYGFSNNHKPRLFKPSFDDCKINVTKNTCILINLID